MDIPDEKVFRLNRAYLLLTVLGSAAFVVGGVMMCLNGVSEIRHPSEYGYDPVFLIGFGIVGGGFFGFMGAAALKKLFDPTPALVLNANGIIDNTSAFSAGFVPWSEIIGFEIYKVNNQKLILVRVTDPDKYIETGNDARRALLRTSYGMSGTSVMLTPSAVEIGIKELLEVCQQYHEKYGKMGVPSV